MSQKAKFEYLYVMSLVGRDEKKLEPYPGIDKLEIVFCETLSPSGGYRGDSWGSLPLPAPRF